MVLGSGVVVNAVAGRDSVASRAWNPFINRVCRADQLSSLDTFSSCLVAHFGLFARRIANHPKAVMTELRKLTVFS